MADTFTCASCEEEWEVGFMASSKWVYPYDEGGYQSDEPIYTEVCANCHAPTVLVGMKYETVHPEEDLPF